MLDLQAEDLGRTQATSDAEGAVTALQDVHARKTGALIRTATGAGAIMAGAEEVHIVGGLEHMQHVPMNHGLDVNPRFFHRTSKPALMMGVTAEFLAQSQGVPREEQDRCAEERRPTPCHKDGKGHLRRGGDVQH